MFSQKVEYPKQCSWTLYGQCKLTLNTHINIYIDSHGTRMELHNLGSSSVFLWVLVNSLSRCMQYLLTCSDLCVYKLTDPNYSDVLGHDNNSYNDVPRF